MIRSFNEVKAALYIERSTVILIIPLKMITLEQQTKRNFIFLTCNDPKKSILTVFVVIQAIQETLALVVAYCQKSALGGKVHGPNIRKWSLGRRPIRKDCSTSNMQQLETVRFSTS